MDNVDEQADDIYNGILGEIGLEYQIISVSIERAVAAKKQEEAKREDAGDDLEARLAALKM